MALVSYSDSEASESESEKKIETSPKRESKEPAAPPTNAFRPSTKHAAGGFQPLVDRSNPRKIRVALPEIKPEDGADGEGDGEPARKRAKIGGGNAFAGFNSLLPPPKRTAQNAAAAATGNKDGDNKTAAPARKVFSLKTGAEPSFDREADAEMRRDQALNGSSAGADDDIPAAGSLRDGEGAAEPEQPEKKEEPKLKGNAMMFKPLSVARNQQKKKPAMAAAARACTDGLGKAAESKKAAAAEAQPAASAASSTTPAPAPPKPKVSLFSISSEERATPSDTLVQQTQGTYQPLVYNKEPDGPPSGPEPEPAVPETELIPPPQAMPSDDQSAAQTLDNIANDLNLSHSERRQLLGRQSASSKSKILTFDTNKEYAANQQLSQTELAAAQHNPVRAIAPGKHTLRQLVNAANSQREALEESFAAARRNKREAGSKYGW